VNLNDTRLLAPDTCDREGVFTVASSVLVLEEEAETYLKVGHLVSLDGGSSKEAAGLSTLHFERVVAIFWKNDLAKTGPESRL